ncbi:MAG: AAA family ATPase [Deltaproteobacteria bacterium]|nr:AAA family ATPase [Deltaproteobacteria bacterium]
MSGPLMLERERELQALDETFRSVARSGGQLVLVCGEAGIGKSTLVGQFLEALPPTQLRAIGYCDPLETPRPLGPLRDIAARLLSAVAPATDEAVFFDVLLQRLTVAESAVLVIEDLHWADERTMDWLKFIGRRIAMLPVLLICSYRDDEVDATHPLRAALGQIPAGRKTQLTLAPLSLEAVRQLSGTSELSPRRLLEVTGGNPFFLTEVIGQQTPNDSVPTTIADALNARLKQLPAEVVRLLEFTSCWPGAVPTRTLTRSSDVCTPDALGHALRHGLLTESDGKLTFRHELARRAVYDRMVAPQQIEAHALFLEALTAGDVEGATPDMIVHHARGARDEARLLAYAPRAAEQAARFGAHREAARYLAYAVRLADRLPPAEAAELYEAWAYEAGLSLAIDAEVIDARQKAAALWRQVGRPERVGENLRWVSRLHWYRGEPEEAQRYIKEALAVLEGEAPSSAKAKAYALRAQFFMLQDQMVEAIEWGQQALAMAEVVGDPEIRVHALNTVGSARLFRGDWAGEPELRESLALSLAAGLHEQAARVYTNLSECLIELRALDRAEQLVEEGIAFDIAHDLDAWTYYLIGRKAQLRFEQDRYEEAISIAQDVLLQENQTLLMRMPALIVRARAEVRLDAKRAEEPLREAVAAAEQIGEPQYLAMMRLTEIEHAVLAGEPARARAAHEWLRALTPGLLSPRKRGEALFWARIAGLGDLGGGEGELPEAFARFLEGALDAAHTAFEREGSYYLATWALGAGRAAEVDARFERIGATAARRYLRTRAGVELPPLKRGPYKKARKHPYGLTGKEQEVLQLLVKGYSNAAIAEELFRSRRTVENHVSSILSKLQAKSRLDIILLVRSAPHILASGL